MDKDMTPKEKAKELYSKIYSVKIIQRNKKYHYHVGDVVKECANRLKDGEEPFKKILLCVVDEIITQWEYIDTYLADGQGGLNPNLKYWQEVKKELECL